MACRVEEIDVKQKQAFANDYISNFSKVAPFFHYSPYEQQTYYSRLQELYKRNFARKELSDVIRASMEKWGVTEQIDYHLQQLERPDSVVVVGGQQAGLLMGPLYTIHKMITIIQFSRQQSSELGIPVIPVFWVAGEDHDFDEINHVFLPKSDARGLDKHIFRETKSELAKKQSISLLSFPKNKLSEWVQDIFSRLPETEFTKGLFQITNQFIQRSDSYVDFFVQFAHHLFKDYGLLFIDSADPQLRKLESSVFCTILEQYDTIHQQVKKMTDRLQSMGYSPQVEFGEFPALLFLLKDGERKLLEKVGETEFRTKDGDHTYQLDELLELAEGAPESFSNNVITRPFMQEALLPTLAFVGGPGEISYWAQYKSYFEQLDQVIPPLVPRISMTLIEKHIEKIMNKRNIRVADLFSGINHVKESWLQQEERVDVEEVFTQAEEDIRSVHKNLMQNLAGVPDAQQIGEKNLEKILEQVDFLKKRSYASLELKHETVLQQFDKVELALFPEQKLQERVVNTIMFLNQNGKEFIDGLMDVNLEANGKHKLIYL